MRTAEFGTSLRFDLDRPLPASITSDAARLRQILINLIANAIKFTPKGELGVVVRSLKPTGDDPQQRLSIDVHDNGIGISEQKLQSLFQPFTQADESISQRFGGTGLGLSITQRLVDALGGQVEVQSTEGVGSRFTVVIPVDPVAPVAPVGGLAALPS